MASRLALRSTRALRFQQPIPSLRLQQTTVRRASGINPGHGEAGSDGASGRQALKTGARRDPELYVLLAIMGGVFSLAGWHFSRNPTHSTSESSVPKIPNSEPWHTGSHAKYQYHPEGDETRAKKDAPSALNVVIIPNVNLPKELHDQYNKYGKEGYP